MKPGDTTETSDDPALRPSYVEDSGDVAAVESAEERPASRLVFPVSGHGLLYDPRIAMEYLEGQAIFRIPHRQPLFRGLINRRGSLVPIYDIRSLLDPQVETRREGSLLVFGEGDDAAGIVLDDTPYRISVASEQETPPPGYLSDVFGVHLGGCFEHGGTYLMNVRLGDFLQDLVTDTT